MLNCFKGKSIKSSIDAEVDEWAKEIATSAELRKWFSHDVQKHPELLEK